MVGFTASLVSLGCVQILPRFLLTFHSATSLLSQTETNSRYLADGRLSPALIWPPLGLPQSWARAPGCSLLAGWHKRVTALEALFRSRLWPESHEVQLTLVSCGVAIETIESQNGI